MVLKYIKRLNIDLNKYRIAQNLFFSKKKKIRKKISHQLTIQTVYSEKSHWLKKSLLRAKMEWIPLFPYVYAW